MRVRVLSRPRAQAPPLPPTSLVLFVFFAIFLRPLFGCASLACVCSGAGVFSARDGGRVSCLARCVTTTKKKIQNVPSQKNQRQGVWVSASRVCGLWMGGGGRGKKRSCINCLSEVHTKKTSRPIPNDPLVIPRECDGGKTASEVREFGQRY